MILTCEQGSDEWFKARLGSIGGSSINSVMAKGKGKMRKSLLYRLAGEILSGEPYQSYQNEHMERGKDQEAEARSLYEFMNDVEVEQVGLFKHSDHKHYSPDGMLPDGLIEIKCTIPSVHIETIDTEKIDTAYFRQMQWGMMICDRPWCDFISYSPLVLAKPMWVYRVERDPALIKEMDAEADDFLYDMARLLKKIKEMPK